MLNEYDMTGTALRQGKAAAEGAEWDNMSRKQQGEYIKALSDTIESVFGAGKTADILKVLLPAVIGKLTSSATDYGTAMLPGRKSKSSSRTTQHGPKGTTHTYREEVSD